MSTSTAHETMAAEVDSRQRAHEPGIGGPEAGGPRRAPVMSVEERALVARWDVGAPDALGWRPQAVLEVRHVRGEGYRAELGGVLRRGGADQRLPVTRTTILVRAEPSIDRRALRECYEAALVLLRQRFDEGRSDVRAHFAAR